MTKMVSISDAKWVAIKLAWPDILVVHSATQ